jgi:hypothetical protein
MVTPSMVSISGSMARMLMFDLAFAAVEIEDFHFLPHHLR